MVPLLNPVVPEDYRLLVSEPAALIPPGNRPLRTDFRGQSKIGFAASFIWAWRIACHWCVEKPSAITTPILAASLSFPFLASYWEEAEPLFSRHGDRDRPLRRGAELHWTPRRAFSVRRSFETE